MQEVISDLLLDIASEKNGYAIGKPWRFTEFSLAAVIPLVRVTEEVRNYKLLSEAKDMVKIRDTGTISKVELFNKDEYPVLAKAGEVVSGATQARTLAVSQVLMPQEKLVVDCACVHSTMGIRGGQKMAPTAYSPSQVRKAVYKGHLSGEPFNQSAVWASVNEFSKTAALSASRLGSWALSEFGASADYLRELSSPYSTPENDLAGRVEETQERLKEVLKKVPEVANQVGMCLVAMTGLELLEAFNHPESWKAIRKAILASESPKISDVSDQNGLFEFREEKAKEIIRELLRKQFEEKVVVSKERTATYILNEERFMGEVVVLDNRPIHCAFLRKAS